MADEEAPKKRGPGRPRKHPPKDPNAPKRGPGRPPKPKPDPEDEAAAALLGDDDTPAPASPPKKTSKGQYQKMDDLGQMTRGVTQTFLSQAFKMDRKTVAKRLAECPVLDSSGSRKVYALHVAAAYLVKPIFNIEEYMATMRPNDLPPLLQDSFWSAQRKRQEWELRAVHLWKTEDVLEILGDLAIMLKNRIQLWPEELNRVHGLTNEMRTQLQQETDNLLESISESLVELPKLKSTPSSVSELQNMSSTQGTPDE